MQKAEETRKTPDEEPRLFESNPFTDESVHIYIRTVE